MPERLESGIGKVALGPLARRCVSTETVARKTKPPIAIGYASFQLQAKMLHLDKGMPKSHNGDVKVTPNRFMLQRLIPALAASAVIAIGGAGLAHENQGKTAASSTPIVKEVFKSTKTVYGKPFQYPEGTAELRLFRVELPVGGEIPLHTHPAPMLVYVQEENSGDLMITRVLPDGKEVSTKFKSGTAFIEGVSVPHYVQNKSDKPTIVWVTVAGVEGMPTTIPVK